MYARYTSEGAARDNVKSLITTNRHGRTSTAPNEYSERFIAFCLRCSLPVLDIGCAFGVATIPALAAGARVIANDIDDSHLAELVRRCPESLRVRLGLLLGRFPDGYEFAPESLGAIHASNVLNFLTGQEIQRGFGAMRRWLAPGGQVFVIAGTPYARNVEKFIPVYEERVATGIEWPGEVEDLKAYGDDPSLSELPSFLHLLDAGVLERSLLEAGFVIETAGFFKRRGLPRYLQLDGRENVAVIARAP